MDVYHRRGLSLEKTLFGLPVYNLAFRLANWRFFENHKVIVQKLCLNLISSKCQFIKKDLIHQERLWLRKLIFPNSHWLLICRLHFLYSPAVGEVYEYGRHSQVYCQAHESLFMYMYTVIRYTVKSFSISLEILFILQIGILFQLKFIIILIK